MVIKAHMERGRIIRPCLFSVDPKRHGPLERVDNLLDKDILMVI